MEYSSVQDKMIEDLLGKSMEELRGDSGVREQAEHKCVLNPAGNRVKCAYCGLMSRNKRTRFQCAVCDVPLCSMGSGKAEEDCITEAHKSKQITEMVLKKHQQMQTMNPRRYAK